MALTPQDVKKIAFLSRIELTDAEITKLQTQLSSIIEYIDQLNEVDTSTIEPLLSITGQYNRMRDDEVEASFTQEEALQNAKHIHNGYIKVPHVFEN